MPNPLRAVLCAVLSLGLASALAAGPSLGLQTELVLDRAEPGAFPLVQDGKAAPIHLDAADHAGVIRAAGDLRDDIARVTGSKRDLVTAPSPLEPVVIIAGTPGRSALVESWSRREKST